MAGLYGIRFESLAPRLDGRLPRMDVAAFVGLAASGPLHTPVPVADPVQFDAIFGGPLPLGVDSQGSALYAYLRPAVHGFFRAGGKRCWIVRVAGTEAASTQFLLPGLCRLGSEGTPWPAPLTARSEGSWADGVRAGAYLQREGLGAGLVGSNDLTTPALMTVTLGAATTSLPIAGDLLALRFSGSSLAALLRVTGVERTGRSITATGEPLWLTDGGHDPDTATCFLRTASGLERSLPGARWRRTRREGASLQATVGGSPYVERIYLPPTTAAKPDVAAAAVPGAVVRIRVAGTDRYLAVNVVSTADGGEGLNLEGEALLAPIAAQAGWQRFGALPSGEARVERLRLGLMAEPAGGPALRLEEVGFGPTHPDWLGHLPTDRALWAGHLPADQAARSGAEEPALWARVKQPRFPLAAPSTGDWYLPIGLGLFPSVDSLVGPVPTATSTRERDGLLTYGPDSFLDPDLATLGAALPGALFHKAEVLGQPLQGAHALWPVEEVALIAAPDLVQPGFAPETAPAEELLRAPSLLPLGPTGLVLDWRAMKGATQYRVETSFSPDFTGGVQATTLTPTILHLTETPCGRDRFARVRAERPGAISPWSNVRWVPAKALFRPVEPPPLGAPVVLRPLAQGGGRWRIAWRPIESADPIEYEVEEATTPDFLDARQTWRGTERAITLQRRAPEPVYVRVRAVLADEGADVSALTAEPRPGGGSDWPLSPWSRTLIIWEPASATRWRPGPVDESALRRAQASLLWLASGRADWLALLSLPQGWEAGAALDWREGLLADLSFDERLLSYGAAYHPWPIIQGAEQSGAVPPDGLAAGVIARRTLARGAWEAPANERLPSVNDLDRPGSAVAEALYAAGVNPLALGVEGPGIWGARTLCADEEWLPLGTRRLLLLLRRLLLREGNDLLFAPNSPPLWRSVERRFEAVLSDLYTRGALRGNTAAEAFRVDVLTRGNQAAIDQGRLLVEIRIAPARPLRFLTVRLIQTGGAPVIEEV
ncbi:MAG TPA: hypothetical protein VK191_12085 [Symbiobacteriaceae bacterium]|nr:hypothetical protein [Symbiobacteriaceae bacterium]